MKNIKQMKKSKDLICISCNQKYQIKSKRATHKQVNNIKCKKQFKTIGGDYSTTLNNINENTIPSVVDILKDPKLGLKHFAKLDAYDTKFKLKDDSLAIKKLPQLKGKEVEIGSYYDPRENLLTIKSGTTSTQVYPEEVEIIASTYTDNKEDYFKKNPTETLAKK